MTPLPRSRQRGPGPLVVAAALVAGVIGAGGTAALWSANGETPLGVITAGDLDLELVGDPVWHETSPDVVPGPQPIDATFLARPGDTVTLQQQFETKLQGDNMRGRVTVDWSRQPVLPAGVRASYSVRDAEGDVVKDVPLGTATPLPTLDADGDTRGDVFTLEVTIDLTDSSSDRFDAGAPDAISDIGTVVLSLDQVRTGEGFTS